MTLEASGGGQIDFAHNSKGELESPKGDANLALSAEENSQKVPVAYHLKDTAAGTTTKFARPEGYLKSTPSYYGQVGWQGPARASSRKPLV